MKFIAILATVFAVANAATTLLPGPAPAINGREAEASIEAYEFIDARELSLRDCVPSSCICNKVQGQFCGNQSINKACTTGHVFECNKNTGKTCDYGVRKTCQQCNKLTC